MKWYWIDKGKPVERQGRKATGLKSKDHGRRVAEDGRLALPCKGVRARGPIPCNRNGAFYAWEFKESDCVTPVKLSGSSYVHCKRRAEWCYCHWIIKSNLDVVHSQLPIEGARGFVYIEYLQNEQRQVSRHD